MKAHEEGYSQVLWLDGVERKYIEEVGAMNIFFKIDGTVVTPMLNGSILPGVTRDTCIQLCKSWGFRWRNVRFPFRNWRKRHGQESLRSAGEAAQLP